MTKTIKRVIEDEDHEEAFLFAAECDSGVRNEVGLTDEEIVAVRKLANIWSRDNRGTDDPNLVAMQKLSSNEARKRFFRAGIAYDSFWCVAENYIKPPDLATYRDLFIEVFVEEAYDESFFDPVLALPDGMLTAQQRQKLVEAKSKIKGRLSETKQ